MACFLVPATEAIITGIAAKVVKSKEKKQPVDAQITTDMKVTKTGTRQKRIGKIAWSRKLSWLTWLLCGGAVLLAFEHIWHGEVVAWFPFLTAVSEGETQGMLQEMATVGVTMTIVVTAVWFVMCLVADVIVRRSSPVKTAKNDSPK